MVAYRALAPIFGVTSAVWGGSGHYLALFGVICPLAAISGPGDLPGQRYLPIFGVTSAVWGGSGHYLALFGVVCPLAAISRPAGGLPEERYLPIFGVTSAVWGRSGCGLSRNTPPCRGR